MQGMKLAPEWRKPVTRKSFFFQVRPVSRMNEEIRCIIYKGKTAKNEWENDESGFLQAFYSLHKKLGQFFFHTY